jgi:hypothetical protein
MSKIVPPMRSVRAKAIRKSRKKDLNDITPHFVYRRPPTTFGMSLACRSSSVAYVQKLFTKDKMLNQLSLLRMAHGLIFLIPLLGVAQELGKASGGQT